MEGKETTYNFLTVLFILLLHDHQHQLVRSHVTATTTTTNQIIQPPCVIYQPNIPESLLINDGEGNCLQEVMGNGLGIPDPTVTFLTTVEEIEMQGYNVTTETFISKDGYISAIYRIYGGSKSPPQKGKQSVILFHGGGGGSAGWIIQPGSRNLAFLLVDNGYEVWLANARGTGPSSNHTRLNADTNIEYWEFSYEEMGTRDLPLMIDLIQLTTGNKQIYYVCHSFGCAVYLTGLSLLPELSNKFKAGFLLAPAAFIGSGDNPYIQVQSAALGRKVVLQDIIFRLLGGQARGERNVLLSELGLSPDRLCSWTALRCGVCDNAIFAYYGADAPQLNYTDLPNALRKSTDNLSIRMYFHGLQGLPTCGFRRYDYGDEQNLRVYGNRSPPAYNLEGVRVPTYIFVGENDNLVAPTDGERLWNNLPPKYRKGLYLVNWPLFNHMDFVSAKDADILVYNHILETINRMESEHRPRPHHHHYDYDHYGWR